MWTPLKPMDRCDLVDLHGGVSPSVALQPRVGLFLQWKNSGRLGRVRRFKNNQIHLMCRMPRGKT